MGNPMNLTPLYTQGIRSEFALSYEPSFKAVTADIAEVTWLDATSDKLAEIYGQLDSPLHPVRWDPGQVIGSKSILSRQFTITNRDYGRRVYLPRNWDDDQTGQAFNVARGLGRNWGLLPYRIFYQYITAATDNDLLPAIPNSADGNAFYLTTTRYGSSSGNVVGQTSSWGTVSDVMTDCFGVLRRYYEFQDTEAQPYWPGREVEQGGISIFVGTSVTLVTQQAEKQMLTHSVVSSTGAAVSNINIASGVNWKWIRDQKITNTNGYFFLRGIPPEKRPLIRQVRKGMTEHQGNWETSDHTRDTGEPYLQFDSREGWGSCLAIATIRVS